MRARVWTVCAFAVGLVGCSAAIGGGDAGDVGAIDAAAVDAGAREDAQVAGDDARVSEDARAAEPDAGARPDAQPTRDAEPTPDAGEVSARFAPTDADLPNPERGWYVWASDDFGARLDEGALDAAAADGVRLALALVDLGAYRAAALPAPFLDALSARFAALRGRGFKAVVRFSYDYTAAGNDAPATQIAQHVGQLAPVLAANADAIAYVQAGFIGAWGEWHSSKNSNSFGYMTNPGVTEAQADANRLIVRDALLAAVPAGLPLGFRYPGDLIKWYPNPSQQARAGLHNDCFLAGPSDTGTYADAAQRAYVATLSAEAAFGGETCDADRPLRTGCDDIGAEGARYHLAYLNREYFQGFFTAWTAGGCLGEVGRQMGYRLQLDAVRHPAAARRGADLRVTVDLRNVGWAKTFAARPLVVTLSRGAATTSGRSVRALSTLPAQAAASTTIEVDVPIPADAEPGVWSLALSAPDLFETTAADPRFSIRFANADRGAARWVAATGRFETGTQVTIE